MAHITKGESEKVRKAARKLRDLLDSLSEKYFDEESWGPTNDLYAPAYDELRKVEREMGWWLD